jgi:CheY-like chemotaxis protein
MSLDTIEDELGLSERTLYREHRKGLEAVATLLWDRIEERVQGPDSDAAGASATVASSERLQAAQTELDHLRPTVHLEPLDVRAVVQGVLELLAPLMEQSGLHISMSLPDAWPALVADRVMLRQVLLNLFSYALQTAHGNLDVAVSQQRGGPVIEVRQSPRANGNGQVLSPGAEPDGVGLAVTQALIEAQGGRLEIDEGGLWHARIVLPGATRATILMIEDNVDIVTLFRRYLAGHKVTLVVAKSQEQALRLAGELQPQAITLDVMMPDEDGWEILQTLKRAPATRDIPVIICSVLQEPALALSLGASDYITKPVERAELLRILQRHLGPLLPTG